MATKQTSSSPLNAIQRYPPMPGHIWRSGTPKYTSTCERCGAVRMSRVRQDAHYAPRVCSNCHNTAQAALMSKLMRRAHIPRRNSTS